MGLPSGNHDPREFEHFAKVNDDGIVVAMVAIASNVRWQDNDGEVTWTDGEGNRYVYLTDLIPLDVHGLQLLPPKSKTHALMVRQVPMLTSEEWAGHVGL